MFTSGFTLRGVKLCSVLHTYQFQIQTQSLAHPTVVFRGFILSSDANAKVITFIFAPCIMESIYCSLTNKYTFY